MRKSTKLLFVLCFFLIVCVPIAQTSTGTSGVLLNGEAPWFVQDRWGNTYKCDWYGGAMFGWYKGDVVYLTTKIGMGYMIKQSGSGDTQAKVWIEQL